MNNNEVLVVVLSRNYSTGLSIVRSLGAAGYTVDLIASSRKTGGSKIISCSKYVRNAVEVVTQHIKNGKEDEEPLAELLNYAGKYTQKPVLFPTDDYTTSVMDLHRELLEDIFIMPTIVGGGNGCLIAHMSKIYQAQLARSVGLLTPQMWVIPLNEDIQIPADMVYPCFVKPAESITGYKKEMCRCNTMQELQCHLEKLQNRFSERSVLVQEFLKIDNEIDFSGVCLDQEIIIPAIIKKLEVAHFEKGVTLSGTVVPAEELGEFHNKVIAMLKMFRYIGMFDMELSIVSDKLYFNEVNLRSGGPNFAYFMSGVNLPALFVKEVLGEKHTKEEECVTHYGKTFIYEKVAWEDYLHGYMSKQDLKKRIAALDIKLLHNDDDPAPGKYFDRAMQRSAFVSTMKDFIRWIKKYKQNIYVTNLSIIKFLVRVKGRLLLYPQYRKANHRDPYAETPRVMIVGRNFCSNLTMARSLGLAGYETEILKLFQKRPRRGNPNRYLKPDAYSKYTKAYYECVSHRKTKRIVNALIRVADPYRKMLLIPSDDLAANVADKYMDTLSQYYIMPNIDDAPGKISQLMSKEVQKELAKAAGLPIVNSCVIRTHSGNFDIPETVTYPCFIKPNISKNSSKSRMRKCDTREDLAQALTEFSCKKDVEILVEDFIQIDKEYAILGLSTKRGVVTPGFFVAEEGGHDAHRGVTMIGQILPTSEMQSFIDDIKNFVASLNFEGLFDVDLIMAADGKLYFTELNLRFGASGYAITASGVNLPGMFADYMLKDKPIDLTCKVNEPGKRFISEKIMLDEYIAGYLTKADMRDKMKSVDIHFILDLKDSKPYHHFRKYYSLAWINRLVYACKKAFAKQV